MDLIPGFKYVGRCGDYKITLFPVVSKRNLGGELVESKEWHTLSGEGTIVFNRRRVTARGVMQRIESDGVDPSLISWTRLKLDDGAHYYSGSEEFLHRCNVVYFIYAEEMGRIKIGYAEGMAARFGHIVTAAPCPVVIIAALEAPRPVEREIHLRFRHLHVHNEWYRDCQEIRDFIASLPDLAAGTGLR